MSLYTNLDQATFDFLNSFSKEDSREGERFHKEGSVKQIFGTPLIIHGIVQSESEIYETKIQLKGNNWIGTCNSEGIKSKAAIFSTMLEKITLKGDYPEKINLDEEKSFLEKIKDKLKRNLTPKEDEFVNKLEIRYKKFIVDEKIFDSDIIRINPRWEVNSFEPLNIWPSKPNSILEFWNYLAYLLKNNNLTYPSFIECITDIQWTKEKFADWEEKQKKDKWKFIVNSYKEKNNSLNLQKVSLKLQVNTVKLHLLIKEENQDKYIKLSDDQYCDIKQKYLSGEIKLNLTSEMILNAFISIADNLNKKESILFINDINVSKFLNRLFHQKKLKNSILNFKLKPFKFHKSKLSWNCQESSINNSEYEINLSLDQNIPIHHDLNFLPGLNPIYMSDEYVFKGPNYWDFKNLIVPQKIFVPKSIIENELGIDFLYKIQCEVPSNLKNHVKEEFLNISFDISIIHNDDKKFRSEYVLLKVSAFNDDKTYVEYLIENKWIVSSNLKKDNAIYYYNRTLQNKINPLIPFLNPTYDESLNGYRIRITKNFAKKYTEWLETIPSEVSVNADEKLSTLQEDPVEAKVDFEVLNEDIDWFNLKVVLNIEGKSLSKDEVKALIRANGNFVRLNDGKWLRLKTNLSDSQKDALDKIGINPFDSSEESYRFHVLQLANPSSENIFNEDIWDKISTRASKIKLDIQPEVPSELNINLRPYQIEGFNFLSYLSENKFGGILADDMGLGKTIQTLTWLLWLRNNSPSFIPSIVVCPKSVTDVWGNEIKKSTPSLKYLILKNNSDINIELIQEDIDVIIINYNQLRSCVKELKKIHWLAVILDEGQQIKNPNSKTTKSAKLLEGQNKLVLSGTPIENSLLDVWSLMSFAMPGILGKRKSFQKSFDPNKDSNSHIRLSSRLKPFLFRRTKSEVAIDLPEKVEEDIIVDMKSTQRGLYEEELKRTQEILLGFRKNNTLGKNSFVILQSLMKLRQIACHPGLIDQKYIKESSAKLNALMYLLNQLHGEGHKVLVFSQFVSMLDIIKSKLESLDRPLSYLTGQTDNRSEVINNFQESKGSNTFLLSLKAGGSGLNLTSANYVILYDPWWNPAVENQAIDRCHRIGQTNKVNAYRIIAKETIEEKIRKLQAKKNILTTSVLGEDNFTKNLNLEDLEFLFDSNNLDSNNK